MAQTKTNETTTRILEDLLQRRIFAWRENSAPIPVQRAGALVGFRSGGKSGKPDIFAVLPSQGTLLGIEVKTGKDKLRPEQIGFGHNMALMGAPYIVVKDFEDYLAQIEEIIKIFSKLSPVLTEKYLTS